MSEYLECNENAVLQKKYIMLVHVEYATYVRMG